MAWSRFAQPNRLPALCVGLGGLHPASLPASLPPSLPESLSLSTQPLRLSPCPPQPKPGVSRRDGSPAGTGWHLHCRAQPAGIAALSPACSTVGEAPLTLGSPGPTTTHPNALPGPGTMGALLPAPSPQTSATPCPPNRPKQRGQMLPASSPQAFSMPWRWHHQLPSPGLCSSPRRCCLHKSRGRAVPAAAGIRMWACLFFCSKSPSHPAAG